MYITPSSLHYTVDCTSAVHWLERLTGCILYVSARGLAPSQSSPNTKSCPEASPPIKYCEIQQHKDSKYHRCQPMVKCKYGCTGLFRHGGELEHLFIHLDYVHETVNSLYAKY